MLEIRGLTKSYVTKRDVVVAVAEVDLDVPRGYVLALLGQNGAGKSTLIRCVAGLTTPDAGTIHVADVDVLRRRRDGRRMMGVAPQELAVFPLVSVRENLEVFGRLHGLTGRTLAARIDEVVQVLGLTHVVGRRATRLSGGEQRRLHTAIALLHGPPLLLLDEPTVGADVESRLALLQTIRRLADEGTAILYTTHYLPDVVAVCDGVAVIHRGEMRAIGSVGDLVDRTRPSVLKIELENDVVVPQPAGDTTTWEWSGRQLTITATDAARTLARAAATLAENGAELKSIDVMRPSLESVYLELVKPRSPEGEQALTQRGP